MSKMIEPEMCNLNFLREYFSDLDQIGYGID